MSLDEKKKFADYIIDNGGTMKKQSRTRQILKEIV